MAHHLTAAVERVLQVQLVDTAHQLQCRRALPERSVVQRRAAHTEQSALPAHTQTLVLAFDHRQSLGPTQRPSRVIKNRAPRSIRSWHAGREWSPRGPSGALEHRRCYAPARRGLRHGRRRCRCTAHRGSRRRRRSVAGVDLVHVVAGVGPHRHRPVFRMEQSG